jgi:hypothetical protein
MELVSSSLYRFWGLCIGFEAGQAQVPHYRVNV